MATPLYQQGTNRIEVIVRKEDGATAKADGDTAEKVTTEDETEQDSEGTSARARFIRVNVTKAYGAMKSIANMATNYYVHEQGLTHGDEALANNIDRQLEVVQDGASIASSVAMGVTYGASGGVPGAVIGAVVGLATSVTSVAFKYANRALDFSYKQFKLDSGVAYQRARAGINLTTGRLR